MTWLIPSAHQFPWMSQSKTVQCVSEHLKSRRSSAYRFAEVCLGINSCPQCASTLTVPKKFGAFLPCSAGMYRIGQTPNSLCTVSIASVVRMKTLYDLRGNTVEVKKLCPYRNRTTTVAVATPWKTTRNCVPAPYVVITYLGLPLRTYGITFNNYEKYRSFHTCRSSPVASPCSRVE